MLRRALVCLQVFLMSALLTVAPFTAHAENQMGYRLLSAQEAASLPSRQGALGMQVKAAQQITSSGLTFEILGVQAVRPGSPGDKAGFHTGDEIIAVEGRVFPGPSAFAKFIGSMQPGSSASFDYIPAGGGPSEAQRLSVTIGGGEAGASGAPRQQQPAPPPKESGGLTTGQKIAIGIGAAALFGCYKLGCFKKRQPQQPQPSGQQPQFRQQH